MPRNLLLLYPVIGAVVCLAALVGFGVSLPNALATAHKKCEICG